MSIGVGAVLTTAVDAATSYFQGKKEQTKVKAKEAIRVTEAVTEEQIARVREQGRTERETVKARSGTTRALIKKPLRWMRRAMFVVLLGPLFIGSLIILGAYAEAWWTGTEAVPNFAPLTLFWTEVVGATPEWWIAAIQQVIAFLWAGGEVTNVAAEAGGAVMDHLRARDGEKRATAREQRKAERERRNRAREERGEEPLPDPEDEADEGAQSERSRTADGDIPSAPTPMSERGRYGRGSAR